MSEFLYEVGDSFEGGPIEIQRYIHEILSVGGRFSYAGNVVTITELPGKPVVAPVEEPKVEKTVTVKEFPAEAPEPVVPEAEELVEATKEAIEEADKEAPKPRGRRAKTAE